MNERIQQLAEHAGVNISPFQFSGIPIKYEVAEPVLEKFADLIIRECVNLCYDRAYRGTLGSLTDGAILCANDIKEYFGVEK